MFVTLQLEELCDRLLMLTIIKNVILKMLFYMSWIYTILNCNSEYLSDYYIYITSIVNNWRILINFKNGFEDSLFNVTLQLTVITTNNKSYTLSSNLFIIISFQVHILLARPYHQVQEKSEHSNKNLIHDIFIFLFKFFMFMLHSLV